jgi:membrane-associated phospholipid phosphatase
MDILYQFGEYGPIFLIILSVYLLRDHKNLNFYYRVGIFANSILNIVLKGIIQEPRPGFDNKKVKLASTHAKEYFFQNGIPFFIYGMPSGHAQSSFFSSIFIYSSLKNTNLLYFYLLVSLIICFQRVKFEYHTIIQLIVGAIIGSVFAYLVYQFAREKIKGKIREKPDDDGPI